MMKTLIAVIVFLSLSISVRAGEEGMPNMPKIQPKKTYKIETKEQGESLREARGYGDQEPMVRMMNLMMVGGSGYEGMDMSKVAAPSKVPSPAEGQTASFDVQPRITPNPPRVGSNILDISVQTKNEAKPAQGLQIKAQVYMTGMNMGTEEPPVREVSPGKYRLKVSFSMAGPWAVKLLLPEGGEKTLSYEVK